MTSLPAIQEFVERIEISSLNCHAECRVLESKIQDELGVWAIHRRGTFVEQPNDDISEGVTHSWVQIAAEDVSDVVSDVIVDPTVEQFTELGLNGHDINEFPARGEIGVYPMNSEKGEHYIPKLSED